MGINIRDLALNVIRPSLSLLSAFPPVSLWSKESEFLLLCTAAVESDGGKFLKQKNGPALGIYQMEPETHDDLWENFIFYRNILSKEIVEAYGKPDPDKMTYNLRYATVMCRLHYFRVKQPLPGMDLKACAEYWKKYYNTSKGKGTINDFLNKCNDLEENIYD